MYANYKICTEIGLANKNIGSNKPYVIFW